MDHFISMYIDDELSLDEKIQFVRTAYGNRPYVEEAISLIKQEKELSTLLNQQAPETSEILSYPLTKMPQKQRAYRGRLSWAVAACLLLIFSFIAGSNMHRLQGSSEQYIVEEKMVEQVQVQEPVPLVGYRSHRFILRQEGTQQVEITGSFTNWQKVELLPTGADDYWEVTLPVPSGEHRYSFIVDGSKRLPDPTVLVKEADDFGTVNSIIYIES